jgi:hypothetical protein
MIRNGRSKNETHPRNNGRRSVCLTVLRLSATISPYVYPWLKEQWRWWPVIRDEKS